MMTRFLRLKKVTEATGLPRSSVYEVMKCDPSFPKPVRISARAVAWLEEEIIEWQRACIAERDG